jgi:O-antigen ligase
LIFSAFLLIDIYSIFLTQSRTGIITLILFLLLFVVTFKKKLIPIVLITFISCGILILERLRTLTYGNISNTFDSILFRFSFTDYKGDVVRDARLDHLDNFIDIVKNNNQLIFGYTSDRYIGRFNQFPHNIFIDIILEYGLIFGIVLIFFIFKIMLKGYLNLKNKLTSCYYFIALAALISLIPLSSLDQKFFWFIIVLFFMSINKKYAYE